MPPNFIKIARFTPRSTEHPSYHKEIGKSLTSAGRELILKYAKVPEDELEAHIFRIVRDHYCPRPVPTPLVMKPCSPPISQRESSYKVAPWSCISSFWFLELGLSNHPHYSALLTRLTQPETSPRFLDLGTCLGQDLRKLTFDGVPSTRLYGSDLFPEFEPAAFEMWNDKSTYRGHFLTGDLFSDDTQDDLHQSRGTWDVVNLCMFLHFLTYADQKLACKRILQLLKPRSESWVIGIQTGSIKPAETPVPLKLPGISDEEGMKSVFRHSTETFRGMWEDVGKEVGVGLDVWVEYGSEIGVGGKDMFGGDDGRRLYFLIETT